MDLQRLSVAPLTEGVISLGWAIDAARVDSDELPHNIVLVDFRNIPVFSVVSCKEDLEVREYISLEQEAFERRADLFLNIVIIIHRKIFL